MPKYQPFNDLPAAQFQVFKDDIEKRGVRVPIIVDEHDATIDGHQRRRACAELGIECPREVVAGLSEDEKVELALALNAFRRHLEAGERREAIQKLRNLGWSTRRIAKHEGISHQAVKKHIQKAKKQEADQVATPVATSEPPSGVDPTTGEVEAPPPPRVVGSDGKSYAADRPQPVKAPPDELVEQANEMMAENVPELTDGPAYRKAEKAIREARLALKNIAPALAARGAMRHKSMNETMEKVDELQQWLTSFRRELRPLKVVADQ